MLYKATLTYKGYAILFCDHFVSEQAAKDWATSNMRFVPCDGYVVAAHK
jgi:hypothetical protein